MNGVDFTLHDKLTIATMLDDLGIDYIEGGYPGANPTDTELFGEDRKLGATFTAFGMTRRPGRSTSNDPGIALLLDAKSDAICFVAKTWDYHVKVALETTNEENLASIRDSVQAAKQKGREVLIDCEHFFDGYKANPQYALACAKAAHEAGARWVVLCDTNGGTLPHEVEADRRRSGEACAGQPCRHPCAQRHRTGGGELARRGARGRAADSGHAQRPWRALRQRQSRLAHPDAEAEARFRRKVRHRRFGRQAEDAGARLAHHRRDAQPRAEPPRALRRRERIRHQGRHPCVRHRQGPGDLRACGARSRRQRAQDPGLRSGGPLERPVRAGAHRPRGRQERLAHHAPARRSEGARGAGLCLRGRRRIVRVDGAARARAGARLLHGRAVQRQRRAAAINAIGQLVTVARRS